MPEKLYSPSDKELRTLAVIWRSGRSLRTSEIYQGVCEDCIRARDPKPAFTTIATEIVKLAGEGLLKAVLVNGELPVKRSPQTMYTALSPEIILKNKLMLIAQSCPIGKRECLREIFSEELELQRT